MCLLGALVMGTRRQLRRETHHGDELFVLGHTGGRRQPTVSAGRNLVQPALVMVTHLVGIVHLSRTTHRSRDGRLAERVGNTLAPLVPAYHLVGCRS